MELESRSDTNCNWRARYSYQKIETGTGGLENKRMYGDHPHYSIVLISQNTANSPEDLKRLAINQTPVENHKLRLVWKTLRRVTPVKDPSYQRIVEISQNRKNPGDLGRLIITLTPVKDHSHQMIVKISQNCMKNPEDVRLAVTQTPVEDCGQQMIVEISHYNNKCPGDLRRLAVTPTPVENHLLKLVWRTFKWV